MNFHFWPISWNWNSIIDFDAHLIEKCELQLSRHNKLFSPPLTPTLVKPHKRVSLLTNFLELNFNLDLNAHLEDKSTCQLSWCWELFSALTKLHDGVSGLTKFSELKLDHRFGCILDRQACMPTFAMFWDIVTPFKPNPVETARQSFTFELFLRI